MLLQKYVYFLIKTRWFENESNLTCHKPLYVTDTIHRVVSWSLTTCNLYLLLRLSNFNVS